MGFLHTVGYLGPEGTFSEVAAQRLGQAEEQRQPFPTFFHLLDAVLQGQLDAAVIPVENSTEGAVGATMDYLAQQEHTRSWLGIVREDVVPIHQTLATLPGVSLANITCIISHPQALAQCGRLLAQRFPHATLREAASTAEAAQQVAARGDRLAAVLCPAKAAERFGLEIRIAEAEDEPGNATRFLRVERAQTPWQIRGEKSSLAIRYPGEPDRPALLYETLRAFAEQSINLTRLESRPTKTGLGTYWFWLDVDAGIHERRLVNALSAIQMAGARVRFLGSYPRAVP